MPACTRGCSVLTRPSRHSGKPVRSSTLVTGSPRPLDQRGRAAGGDQLDAGVVQAADQVLEPGLVVDGDQGAPDRDAGRADVGHGSLLESVRRGAPRRSMLPGVTPWWSPTCASRVAVSLVGRSRSTPMPHLAPSTADTLAGHPADGVDEHRPLGDLDPLVQRLDGVVVARPAPTVCATIGPVSTPPSTTKRVAPVTLTPYARASAGPCMPGNDGDSAGWVLTRGPRTRPRNSSPTSFMKPAETTRSGSCPATVSASARSQCSRRARSR